MISRNFKLCTDKDMIWAVIFLGAPDICVQCQTSQEHETMNTPLKKQKEEKKKIRLDLLFYSLSHFYISVSFCGPLLLFFPVQPCYREGGRRDSEAHSGEREVTDLQRICFTSLMYSRWLR